MADLVGHFVVRGQAGNHVQRSLTGCRKSGGHVQHVVNVLHAVLVDLGDQPTAPTARVSPDHRHLRPHRKEG